MQEIHLNALVCSPASERRDTLQFLSDRIAELGWRETGTASNFGWSSTKAQASTCSLTANGSCIIVQLSPAWEAYFFNAPLPPPLTTASAAWVPVQVIAHNLPHRVASVDSSLGIAYCKLICNQHCSVRQDI